MKNRFFIFDFDSTITQVEALDEWAHIILAKLPETQAAAIKNQVAELTRQGMDGAMPVSQSILTRLQLLKPNLAQLPQLVERLQGKITPSFLRNKVFFQEWAEHIYVISSGFKEFIVPVVAELGIAPSRVFANEFVVNGAGNIVGMNTQNPLSKDGGKAEQVRSLGLKGEIHVVGDGYTDYEIKKEGAGHVFFAFVENVRRERVTEHADHIVPNLDEFLYINKLNAVHSYPKNRIKALLLENVHPAAIALMKAEGFDVESYPKSLSEEELCERIKDVSILGIRSKTEVTAKVLANAKRLMAIGAFCIGTNQIDVSEAAKKGIPVFNAPFSNTRSVVELAIAQIIMLMRNIFDKSRQVHQGVWNKSADNSFEIRGKKLGIVGYGNIGSQLSVLAENMGMKVFYYDVEEKLALGNATKVFTLHELLALADVVSLHIDGRKSNQNIIGTNELRSMKKGAILINLSRGSIIDLKALRENILSKHILGCAVDVFPQEPLHNQDKFESELCGLPNTILTPHIGGSTAEAQESIGNFVPRKLINYINTGNTSGSFNFPNLSLPNLSQAHHRFIHIHSNVPGILAKINTVMAQHNINVLGQYLKTNEHIGYVITDIDKDYDNNKVIRDLRNIEHTIKFRVLY